jgi:hypothetical protein
MELYLPTVLDRLAEQNNAGACYLQFIPVANIDSFPEEVRGTLPSAIDLIDDAVWTTIYPTRWTQDFSEGWVKVNGANCSKASLTCVVPKDRAAIFYGLWQLHRGRFVVLHHDLNKTVKVLGTKDEPAMVNVVELSHGSKPGSDRNHYELQVTVTRSSPCPFYLSNAPVPGVPDDCPTLQQQLVGQSWATLADILSHTQLSDAQDDLCQTLGELISGTTWPTIEALLSTPQLNAAIASICPTLCALLDDALTASPVDAVVVSGAGDPGYDGIYTPDGTNNGRTLYRKGTYTISWSGTAWVNLDEMVGTEWYNSSSNVTEPWNATGWTAMGGLDEPVPTFAQDGAVDASVVTDCLSPTQASVLLAALGGTPATLCDLLDESLASSPIDAVVVSGAGDPGYNGTYTPDGTNNGRTLYRKGTHTVSWSGTAWVNLDEMVGTEWYNSASNVTEPWNATGWTAMGGLDTPVPTYTQANDIDASEVVDCLSPEQADAVAAALGASGEDVEIQLVDSDDDPIGSPDTYSPGTVTTKTAPDGAVQLKDSSGANIGSPVGVKSGGTANATAPDGAVQVKDSAGTNIGSPVAVKSGGTANATAPDGAVQVKDSAGTNIGAPVAVKSGGTANATAPDGTVTIKNLNGDTLGTQGVKSNGTANYTAPIPLKFGWGAGNADTLTWTVSADEAGTYTAYTSDGGSGTINYSKNGGGFASVTGSITLAVSDTIVVRRTITTNAGWSRWAP